MIPAYTLTQTHAWMVILNEKIEQLCERWEHQYPPYIAEQKIDDFMELARCLRQEFVHRDNYQKFNMIVDIYLNPRLA